MRASWSIGSPTGRRYWRSSSLLYNQNFRARYHVNTCMRHTRWLFLAAIVAIVFMVVATYVKRRNILASEPGVHPKPLETGVDGQANDWQHTVFKGDQKHF